MLSNDNTNFVRSGSVPTLALSTLLPEAMVDGLWQFLALRVLSPKWLRVRSPSLVIRDTSPHRLITGQKRQSNV
jgi:hypothetical protein